MGIDWFIVVAALLGVITLLVVIASKSRTKNFDHLSQYWIDLEENNKNDYK